MTDAAQNNNTHGGAAPNSALGPGAIIRAAREKQGLHIAALAAAIKVAPRKLDALENDRWDDLPDATFTRALAQTVCRTLKIDAAPVLEKLPALGGMGRPGGGALNEPFRERPGREEPGVAGLAVRPMVWAAGLLMLAALALYLAPKNWWQNTASAPAAATGVATPSDVKPAAPAASMPLATLPDTAAVPASAAPSAAASAQSMLLPAVAETVFSAPPPGAATSANAASAVTGVLNVRTSESAWVEVRDASGQVLLRSFVTPSESINLDGALPLRLVVGNATAVQLLFKGQAVDLANRAKGNVARFDLP
jgi:cytoskeleton protein RodZ